MIELSIMDVCEQHYNQAKEQFRPSQPTENDLSGTMSAFAIGMVKTDILLQLHHAQTVKGYTKADIYSLKKLYYQFIQKLADDVMTDALYQYERFL